MALFLCVSALADYVPVKLELSVNPSVLTGPRSVEVTVKVSNTGDDDLLGNVSLYGPDGKVATDFGDGGSTMLKRGASYSGKTTWRVTEAQLNSGKLTYSLRYPIPNEDGEIVYRSVSQSVTIRRSVPDPEAAIKRSISAPMAKKGQQITVTYDIENTGDVTLENIRITEHRNIASRAQTIEALEPGQIGRAEFPVTMGDKDLTSEATITYKAAGNTKTYTQRIEATKIIYGSPSLEAKLESSAKSTFIDSTIKLKLTLTNTGNVDYQNIRVTDAVLGEIFTNQEVAANQKLELEKEITVRENQSYMFNIEATDSSGNEMTLASNKVDIVAVDPSKQLELHVTAYASSDVIYEQPGVLTFRVTVDNIGEVDAKDVQVTCGQALIYTFDEIKAGDTLSFSRLVSATQAGKFQFVASTKDQLNNTVTFNSEMIQISYTQPTPEPTTAPTLPAPTLWQDPLPTEAEVPALFNTVQSIMKTAGFVFATLLALAVLLLLIASSRRRAAKKESDKAYDHFERAARRDYAREAPRREPVNDKEPEAKASPEAKEADTESADDLLPDAADNESDSTKKKTNADAISAQDLARRRRNHKRDTE